MSETLALALIHFLWQGALLAAVAALLLRSLRRPEQRYVAASAVFCAMAAAPLITLWFLGTATRTSQVAAEAMPDMLLLNTAAAPGDPRWFAWVCALWAAGVTVFGLRAAGGLGLIAWQLRKRADAAPSEWQATVQRIAARTGLRRAPLLMISTHARIASVFGAFRPVIVLPASALSGLPAAQIEAILAHEAAHIVRRDFIGNCVQCAVEAILFYHPAVWWLSARIREERELCCDAAAVEVCGDAVAYSHALLALEESRQSLVPAANGSGLRRRIETLLGREADRGSGLAWVPMLLGIAGAMAAATALASPPEPPPDPPAPPAPAAQAARPSPTLRVPAPPAPPPPPAPVPAPPRRDAQSATRAVHEYLPDDAALVQPVTAAADRQTEEDARKAEHKRRTEYAQERFGGAHTPRGRIYVQNGPPAEIQSWPSVPREIWLYGNDVEFEFGGSNYDLVRFRFKGKDFEPKR